MYETYNSDIEGNRNWKRVKIEQPADGAVYCLVRTKIGNVKISTKVIHG